MGRLEEGLCSKCGNLVLLDGEGLAPALCTECRREIIQRMSALRNKRGVKKVTFHIPGLARRRMG